MECHTIPRSPGCNLRRSVELASLAIRGGLSVSEPWRTVAIRDRLLRQGEDELAQPPSLIDFTGNREANLLLNDLTRYPHAFLIGCIMDRQMPFERAWLIPYYLSQRLGTFEFEALAAASLERITTAMTSPSPLHRFPDVMAGNVHAALQRVDSEYQGDASRIWADRPPSAGIVRKMLEFRGVGPKIATMAANILVRDFRIPVSDRYSIDVSVDVHIQRLFRRLGLVDEDAGVETIIYRARELNPEYPGIFDLPLWELGKAVCHPSAPRCPECSMADLCPHRSSGRAS